MSLGALAGGMARGLYAGTDINERREDREFLRESADRRTPQPAARRPSRGLSFGDEATEGGSGSRIRTAYYSADPGEFGNYETQYGLPSGYLNRTMQIESRGDVNAVNPNSGAAGPFQFISSTARQYGLDNPHDLRASADAAARLARDNASVLRSRLGRDPTAAELYLAHQQGAGGAAKLLANPNARAADLVGKKAVEWNGGRPDMTAQEFANLWLRKFGTAGPGAAEVRPADLSRNTEPAWVPPPLEEPPSEPSEAPSPTDNARSLIGAALGFEGKWLDPEPAPSDVNGQIESVVGSALGFLGGGRSVTGGQSKGEALVSTFYGGSDGGDGGASGGDAA